MHIEILHFSGGARKAQELAVVIDVFRAFSVACHIFAKGAERIVAVQQIDRARQLRQQNPSWVLVGERGGRKLEGFDYGNSPTELEDASLEGTTVVQTTHAGTQNLCAVGEDCQAVAASFLNAGATINYIRGKASPVLSLVCSGVGDEHEATEDLLCAEYIRDALTGTPRTFEDIKEELVHAETSQRFFDPKRDDSPESDFHRCLEFDRFDFTLHRTESDNGLCVLERHAGIGSAY